MKLSKAIYAGFLVAAVCASRFAFAETVVEQAIVVADDESDMEPAQDFDAFTHPITCYVSNARGQTFTAVGANPQLVAQRAYNKCARVSVRCTRPVCRY